jgi:nicotinate phosphoribosyltransferase
VPGPSRFGAGQGTLLPFAAADPDAGAGFDPQPICKVHEVEGRPAVKLSDNYAKAMGSPAEIERYRRIFGTVGVANVPVLV